MALWAESSHVAFNSCCRMEAELADTEEKLEKQTEHLQQVPSLEDIPRCGSKLPQMMDVSIYSTLCLCQSKNYTAFSLAFDNPIFWSVIFGLSH